MDDEGRIITVVPCYSDLQGEAEEHQVSLANTGRYENAHSL